jgi:hypothetical protein
MRDRPDTSENAPSRTCARATASMVPVRAPVAPDSRRVSRAIKREQTPDGRVHAPPRRVGRRRGTDPTTLGSPADACIRDEASARAAPWPRSPWTKSRQRRRARGSSRPCYRTEARLSHKSVAAGEVTFRGSIFAAVGLQKPLDRLRTMGRRRRGRVGDLCDSLRHKR